MNRTTAELIEPIFQRTWALREMLRGAGREDIARAQAELKQLLSSLKAVLPDPRNSDFLGPTYALVCWIDEIMTGDAAISRLWNESKLEGDVYGTNDRAWKFWRQAELAESLENEDALEVYFLCVANGFSGKLIDQPETLDHWIHRARIRTGRVPELTLPFDHDLPPAPDVRPLRGHRALRRMMAVGWAASIVLFPTISYLAIRSLTR